MAGFPFPDELRFFAHELGHRGDAGEINVLGNAWTSRVTSHVPIAEVPRLITAASICQKAIRLLHQTVRKSGIDSPRIAVAALNPHAGEGGNFGREEIEVIRPAILQAVAEGINVDGPFPSDTVFLKLRDGMFDAVVTMYHDQGQIAMKLMGFQRGVTVCGGLPIPITTPAHGTAFDIVGQGRADVGAMVEAFRLAIRWALNWKDRGSEHALRQEEAMTKTLYCAKLLIDGTGKPPIEDAAVCTEGDRILSVGKRQDFGSDFDGRKIDLGEQTLLPGLIDCHNHLCLDASIPNWPAKFDVGDIELTLRAVRNMAADLQAGDHDRTLPGGPQLRRRALQAGGRLRQPCRPQSDDRHARHPCDPRARVDRVSLRRG